MGLMAPSAHTLICSKLSWANFLRLDAGPVSEATCRTPCRMDYHINDPLRMHTWPAVASKTESHASGCIYTYDPSCPTDCPPPHPHRRQHRSGLVAFSGVFSDQACPGIVNVGLSGQCAPSPDRLRKVNVKQNNGSDDG